MFLGKTLLRDYWQARLDATGARLFTNNGDGTFAHPVQSYPSGWDFSPNSSWPPITADFDGDYRTDYARLGDTQAYLFIGK